MDTSSYLPPKFSLNSFFVRHVAHPKRMRYIQGLNNSKICAVNDVGYINGMQPDSQFPPNNFNETLLKNYSTLTKRKERAVPPNGIWQTFGMIDNSDKWRTELNSLASSIGLITQADMEEMRRKKERDDMIKSIQAASRKPESQQRKTLASSNGTAQNHNRTTTANGIPPQSSQSNSTTRLNEPLPTGRRRTGASRRSTRGASSGAGVSGAGRKFLVDHAEREAWMLQVLCQILQTESLVDVQSWLVSASDSDKEKVKQLIDQAMRGLEESGRIDSSSNNEARATAQFVNPLVESQTGSTMSEIENHLKRIDLDKLTRPEVETRSNLASSSSSTSRDRIKLPKMRESNMSHATHSTDEDAALKKKLDAIPEVLQINDNDEGRVTSPGGVAPTTGVLSINLKNPHPEQSNKLPFIENAVVKLETPMASSKDFKIEQVKVTMLVKDEKSNNLQEINGDWTPNDENNNTN